MRYEKASEYFELGAKGLLELLEDCKDMITTIKPVLWPKRPIFWNGIILKGGYVLNILKFLSFRLNNPTNRINGGIFIYLNE